MKPWSKLLRVENSLEQIICSVATLVVQRWQKLLFCCPGWNLTTQADGWIRKIVCVVHHKLVHHVMFRLESVRFALDIRVWISW